MQEGQLLCGLEILQRWSGKIIFMIDAENHYKNEDKSYIKKAFKMGASGYVTKSTAHEEILKAIDVVMENNEIYREIYTSQNKAGDQDA